MSLVYDESSNHHNNRANKHEDRLQVVATAASTRLTLFSSLSLRLSLAPGARQPVVHVLLLARDQNLCA